MADACRPTLTDAECSEHLDREGSGARLIRRRIIPEKPLPRDFSAYFYSSSRNNDPSCVVTSHFTRDQLPLRRTVIPAYPCVQSLRWSPHVQTTSIEEEPETPEEPQFNCKCENCETKKCPSRVANIAAERGPVFKDNIMTFCDQQTMTPRVNEVGCGSTPSPSRRVSDVSVSVSDIAVKDTQAGMEIHPSYTPHRCRGSILKRSLNCCEHDYKPACINTDSGMDMYDDYNDSSSKLFSKYRSNKEYCNSRRNLYNEGISDKIADQLPIKLRRVPSPTNLLRNDYSRVSVRSEYHEEGIPFSHRSDSRYHHNCKKSSSRSFYGDVDELRYVVASPEVVRKNYSVKHVKYHKLPPTRMPKRVLTSERDIESYVDRGRPQLFEPGSGMRRGN